MEVNRKARRNIALLILALVFACVSVILVGMLVGEVIGHINEKSCEVVGASINQLAPPTQNESLPQTTEACLNLVRAAQPLYTFVGIFFTGVFAAAILGIVVVVGLILGKNSR